MRLVSPTPAISRRRRWTGAAVAVPAAAAAGLLLLRPGAAAVLWVLLAAAVTAHVAGRRASDCSVLADLSGWSVGDLATQLAAIPARSASPLVDLARIRAVGGGVVIVDGAVRVLPERRVEHLDVDLVLPGHWWDLALPAPELPAGAAADRLRRLPDEDEVWLVRTDAGVRMVSGDGLRAAAAAVRGVRARGVRGGRRRLPSDGRGGPAHTPHARDSALQRPVPERR